MKTVVVVVKEDFITHRIFNLEVQLRSVFPIKKLIFVNKLQLITWKVRLWWKLFQIWNMEIRRQLWGIMEMVWVKQRLLFLRML